MTRCALASISFAVALTGLEATLRIVERPAWRATGVVGMPPRGGEAEVHDRRVAVPVGDKPEGVFRVLVVGDSVTWGSGVHAEDAYPARLARRLRDLDPDRSVEVVSWSRAGWNSSREWSSLEPHLDRLEADLVILGYSLNDPEPDRIDVASRRTLERRVPRSFVGYWLHEHSRAVRFVYGRLENSRQRRAANAYYHGLYDEAAAARRRQVESLRDWSAELASRRVPMAMVIFPMFETQLDGRYPYRELHQRTAALGRDLGLPVLDLLPRYGGIDARRLAVEPFTDSHPNELAHRVAADVLAGWLADQGLLRRLSDRT